MEPEQRMVTQYFMTVPHSRAELQCEAMLATLPRLMECFVFLRGHPGRARHGKRPLKGNVCRPRLFPTHCPHSATSETEEQVWKQRGVCPHVNRQMG